MPGSFGYRPDWLIYLPDKKFRPRSCSNYIPISGQCRLGRAGQAREHHYWLVLSFGTARDAINELGGDGFSTGFKALYPSGKEWKFLPDCSGFKYWVRFRVCELPFPTCVGFLPACVGSFSAWVGCLLMYTHALTLVSQPPWLGKQKKKKKKVLRLHFGFEM